MTRPPADHSLVDPDDTGCNPTNNPQFADIVASRLNRRRWIGLGLGSAGAALLQACGGGADVGGFQPLPMASAASSTEPSGGTAPATDAEPVAEAAPAAPKPLVLGFKAVPKHLADTVSVPPGYTASVLYRLGDPIASDVPAYKNDGSDDAATYDRRAGDHHDGMTFFGIDASNRWDPTHATRGLLVMNHESITPVFLHPAGQTVARSARTVASEVLREFYLHGVSVIEVGKQGNTWTFKQDSHFNRRIHTLTEMKISGPAARTDAMKTKYARDGSKTRGTVNNCANGTTPWGTYLTCEENWAGYFRRNPATDEPRRTDAELRSFERYGVAGTGRHRWATPRPDTPEDLYGRWNTEVAGATALDDYRNVCNTYGWVVEIDPFDPSSTSTKRTALGRFGHEGACLGPVAAGKPLVWYMGDDAQDEYLYKFVSTKVWDPADVGRGLAAGDKYMDDGKLYVARFNDDGTGDWLELRLGLNNITANHADYAFADAADVLINTRLAADAAGATMLDRPEWTAVNPTNGHVYLTLTNNSGRKVRRTDAANPRSYNDPKGVAQAAQTGNPNGHIVRLADAEGEPAAVSFTWDVYLFGARATASTDVNLSKLAADNDFSSPDGMWFSEAAPGLLWLQTDDGKYTDVTNCMMLAALPGEVGDGVARTIVNSDGVDSREQATFVGKPPGTEGLRRFLVGPVDCEITGVAESGDGRALFVNIQHPGEDTRNVGDPAGFTSHWPDGDNARPRSATVVITRDDGGVIGL
ncbi:PhoX family protein [Variovorax sp. RB2P76]|uniref:PhoX family protein n=1 Tax=Variovorax sp. RB2P76 TaxID=3443736 RepID=UPI003F44902A